MKAMIATRKGLFDLVKTDAGWQLDQASFLGEPVSMCLHDQRDGSVYAALNLGHFGVKLHRRDSDHADWTEIAVPAYPEQLERPEGEVEWKLKMIWSLVVGGNDEPGVLWAGTLPGGLFRSRDRGNSWELMRSLWDRPERKEWLGGGYDVPGIHSICVDPRNSQHVLVGISCGGAWQTRDGGTSWTSAAKGMRANYMPPELADSENVQDPHLIVRCKLAPDVLWCQHHNGIWRSADDAASWQQLTTPEGMSDFGFAVASHPRHPDVAWFVPAEADQRRVPKAGALSVTRTRDGGKTFETLSKGLPQQDCYDLIYRHGLVVADDGQTLLMASTTGKAWISENAGDDWQQVATYLPPVYAVRFY
ncbi:WD40/YVTN/BNR-like repeat-containing protein [Undibacterium sp. Jales W-56]|uniref:WD40/YVTN/BNR-like repeat-containing protein n=1 Tax=Undibacterium sp. Jales W-56 TaxID=2897325 RepID=UPI00397776A0